MKSLLLLALTLSIGPVVAQPTDPQALQNWIQGVPALPHGSPRLALSGYVLPNAHTLVLKLTNISARPISTYPFRLPWGNPNSLNLFGLTTRGQVLKQSLPIADPIYEKPVVIAPGQSLTGNVDLSFKLNGFPEARVATPVIVVWSYELEAGESIITGAAVAGRLSATEPLP